MTNEAKKKQLYNEIRSLKKEHFIEERKQKFKSELDSIEYSKKFHNELNKYIEKRKKELGIDNSTK